MKPQRKIYVTRKYIARLAIEANRMKDVTLAASMKAELMELMKLNEEGMIILTHEPLWCFTGYEHKFYYTITKEDEFSVDKRQFNNPQDVSNFLCVSKRAVHKAHQTGRLINGYSISKINVYR